MDLTQGQGGFLGIAGQSEDLSRIYFVDTAACPARTERREEAEGPANPTSTSTKPVSGTRFIATAFRSTALAETENSMTGRRCQGAYRRGEPRRALPRLWSTAPLTGYDNVGPCREPEFGANITEFVRDRPARRSFSIDSATGRLTCPSCNPTGEAPLGNSTLRRIEERRKRVLGCPSRAT